MEVIRCVRQWVWECAWGGSEWTNSCAVNVSPSVRAAVCASRDDWEISFILPLWIWLRRVLSQLLWCGPEWGRDREVLFKSGQKVPSQRDWVAADARRWLMWPDLLTPFPLWDQERENRCSICARDTGNQLVVGFMALRETMGFESWEGPEEASRQDLFPQCKMGSEI